MLFFVFACMLQVCVAVIYRVRICSSQMYLATQIPVLTKNRLDVFVVVIMTLLRHNWGPLCFANRHVVFLLAI